MKTTLLALLAAVAVGTIVPAAANAQSADWLVVPDLNVDAFEPHSPYTNNLDLRWTYEAPDCASSLRIVFDSVDIETDLYYWYDWVQLNDGSGNRIQRIDGEHAVLTSAEIPGNSVEIWFHSDQYVTRDGYQIARIEALGCRPCELKQCPMGDVCREEQVYCIRAPCPPIAVCEPPPFCATVRCAAGYHCDEEARDCVPDEPILCEQDTDCPVWKLCNEAGVCEGIVCPMHYAPVCGADGTTHSNTCYAQANHVEVMHAGDCTESFCATALCGPNTYCDEERDTCVDPCADHECREGEHCELVPIVCVTWPCYPIPECRPDPETCEQDSDCPSWFQCNAEGVCEHMNCTEEYHAVCGMDGVTYDNDCYARAHHTEVAHDGECIDNFCATVLCAENSYCHEERDTCVNPCATVLCGPGQFCEMRAVQCFAAPCYPVGMCIDDDTNGDLCASDEACGEGMVCSGIFHSDEGICLADDSRGTFEGEGGIAIPDNDPHGIKSAAEISGLWTVPTDIVLNVRIGHTYRGDLKVTLTDPNGDIVTLHDREGGSADDLVFEAYPVSGFSMDDAVNGTWTLIVSDHAGWDTGSLESWSLLLGSRMD